MADVHRTSARVRWVVPFTLAIGSLLISLVALAVVASSFTEQNAPLVRVGLFGVVPALGLVAVVAAMTASHRVRRIPWSAAMIGLAALIAACAAHVTWYGQTDAEDGVSLTFLWVLLVVTAVSLAALAIALILIPSLSRSGMPKTFGVVLGIVAGLVGGVTLVAFLALPFAGPIVSVATLATVIALERGDREATSSTSAGVAA